VAPTAGHDLPGVLITLSPSYLKYARAEGKALHAKYAGVQNFGRRTEGGRIASSGARRALEQLLGIPAGDLRRHGLDCVSSRTPHADRVHVRPEHRGRVYFVVGPLDGPATFLIYGSIDSDVAKARPIDLSLDPPAHVWRVAELDPPPAPEQGVLIS
jgi:hypothetical protein